jgi:sulfur carrier protein ThiS
MKVKVLRLGHSATVIEVPAGTAIEEALDTNDIPRQGYSVSVNGLGAGPATVLGEGDVVTLVPKVEGGSTLDTAAGSRQ